MNNGDGARQEPSLPLPIAAFLRDHLGGSDPVKIHAAKSAQQVVLVLQYEADAMIGAQNPLQQEQTSRNSSAPLTVWRDAFARGNQHLVVRYWKGGSRWWNLNRKSTQVARNLAAAEMTAYQIASQALGDKIPRLLYRLGCAEDSGDSDDSSSFVFPWAVLEYVGPRARRFRSSSSLRDDESGGSCRFDSYWMESMIKVRDEFGFPEPHPRWGRVPEDESLDYALAVLHEVTVPLHKWCIGQQEKVHAHHLQDLLCDRDSENDDSSAGYTFRTMVHAHRQAHSEMKRFIEHQEESVQRAIDVLDQCVKCLEQEVESNNHLEPMPFVLVHMDCQPQNLIFASSMNDNGKKELHVSAVLDWEEAAYADPRFELLLLGRKVCTNQTQAEHLWQAYQQAMTANNHLPAIQLGPLEPWLRLETVHSLTTLLLQLVNEQKYGRSAWETKPDLWGKIEREFQRLAAAGWSFCDEVALLRS